jgi:hypothetical protein
MDRRRFLAAAGTTLAATAAGCLGDDGDGSGGGGGEPNGTATDAPDDAPTDAPGDTSTDGSETPSTDEPEDTPADGSEAPSTDDPGTEPTDGDDATTDTDGSPGDGTDDGTPSDGSSGVGETSFEVLEARCGSGADTATVAVDGGTVTVDGVAGASNACYTARLGGATLADGTLTLSVGTYVPESEQETGCATCLYDVSYTATATVSGDAPGTVVVEHDGEVVTRADALEG